MVNRRKTVFIVFAIVISFGYWFFFKKRWFISMLQYFKSLDSAPPLCEQSVHVWVVDMDQGVNAQELECLSSSEVARIARFSSGLLQRRRERVFVSLRELLAHYLSVSAKSITFKYGKHGKPYLSEMGDKKSFYFNISHSKNIALMAFSQQFELGVDIEYQRDSIDVEGLSRRFFARSEHNILMAMSEGAERIQGFYRYWALKEAVIKATGKGLSCPLREVKVSLASAVLGRSLLALSMDQDFDCWYVRELNVDSAYSSAIAVRGDVDKLGVFAVE